MQTRYLLMVLIADVSLLGCGGGGDDDDDGIVRTADFAAMTSEELRTVIELSNGAGAGTAYLTFLGAQIDSAETGNQCPVATVNGPTLTLAANGCLTETGIGYKGRISATNALTFEDLGVEEPSVDPNEPMSLVFTVFEVHVDDSELDIAGTIHQTSPTLSPYSTDTDLAITSDGQGFDEEVSTTCNARNESNFSCDIERAVFHLDGLGTFTVEGSFGRAQGDPVGTLEMRGIQRMRVTLGAGPCHEFDIGDDGNDRGEICWDE